MSEQRDLRADLMALQLSQPEWRELPIIKEQLKQASFFKSVFEKELNKQPVGFPRSENATLTKENDLQRHSIQQLSAQVVDLQKLNKQLLEYIAPIDGCDCEGCIDAKEIIKKYGLPSPGADLLDKIAKLEAIAEAAKKYRNAVEALETAKYDKELGLIDIDYYQYCLGEEAIKGQELTDALAAYEGSNQT
jgi:hypothetical protein